MSYSLWKGVYPRPGKGSVEILRDLKFGDPWSFPHLMKLDGKHPVPGDGLPEDVMELMLVHAPNFARRVNRMAQTLEAQGFPEPRRVVEDLLKDSELFKILLWGKTTP